MIKKLPLFSLLVVLITSFGFSQTRNVKSERMQIPSDQNQIVVQTQNQESLALTPGTQLFNTGYDYMCNNTIAPMIGLADLDAMGGLDPIMCGMQRFIPTTGDRTTRFAYIAFGVAGEFSAFDETNGTSGSPTYGWGSVQLLEGGPWDGDVMMMAHSGGAGYHTRIDLVNFEPRIPFPTVSVGGNFPSFTYQSDGSIITTDTDYWMYLSTDEGATFDSISFVGDGDTLVNIIGSDGPAEAPIWRSTDGMYLSIMGIWPGIATSGNPDAVYIYSSTDGGGTWNGTIAGVGSGGANVEYDQVTNRDPYAPYFENFAQIQGNVSNDGVSHIAVNGYGEGAIPGPDTTNMYTILYWNSNHQDWIAVSMPEMEGEGDGFGNIVTDGTNRWYPGNGIGQAYPTLSVSDNGQVVLVMWQAYEYTGAVGTSEWNIYPGDNGAETGEIYFTDLYYAYSEDGGATWSDVEVAKGDADVMEQYPQCAQLMLVEGNQATVHYMYQEDAVPGIAVFNGQVVGQNSWSTDTYWLHDVLALTLTTGVEDDVVVNDFTLEQNYPNPFNPGTQINYTLAERSSVTLKVYDVLGNEIATLVNTTQEAGAYDVTFDASQLSSGLYIYTLNAGNFTSSKKMMLMK